MFTIRNTGLTVASSIRYLDIVVIFLLINYNTINIFIINMSNYKVIIILFMICIYILLNFNLFVKHYLI